MSDEKRIKDFEPATELLIDDWFAVDSPSQGTRKMQASMFQEGLQTQITTNTENIALHSGQISVLQQGVGNIGDKVDVLDAAITVEEYSATKLYAVDEDCVYEGVRYKCITAIETPEAFTPSHWQAISIEGELNELNSSITTLNNYNHIVISGAFQGNINVNETYHDYTINFSRTLSSIPNVLVSVLSSTSTQQNVPIPAVTTVTKTSFTCRVWRQVGAGTTGGIAPNIRYIAII